MVWSRGCPLEVAGWHCSMHGPRHDHHTGSQAAGKQQQLINNAAHLKGCPAIPEMLDAMVQDTCCQNRATGGGSIDTATAGAGSCSCWGQMLAR